MEKQNKAIIETLQQFLQRFSCRWDTIQNPYQELEKYFTVFDDWEVISFYLKTPVWDFSMGYTTDIRASDIQSLVNWLKNYADIKLRLDYKIKIKC